MNARLLYLLTCTGMLATITGCSPKHVRAPAAANTMPDDNSYLDLKPGGTLRIVVPLLKNGAYETSSYAITGKGKGSVRLKFESAGISRNRKMIAEPNPPVLPFELPRRAEHIRLIYLVRISRADHNMAIVASKHLDALDAFTKQLKQNPSICERDTEIFCSWVPMGVAVRPEGQ